MNLFTLMATIGLDTTEFEAGVKKATSTGQALSGTMNTRMATAAVAVGNLIAKAAAAVGDALVKLPGQAIEAAAEVQAENAAFASSFGDLAGDAKAAFESIGQDTNILSTRLQAVGTKGYAQLKGAGLSANDALTQSDRLLRLAADAAAYYDISLEDADTRIRSFMRGNTEAGDAIGLFTSESQRNAYAIETYGTKWQNLTEAQRQMLMLNISEDIYKQSGAIGQASREANGWANVTANLGEAWRQTLATIGKPLMEALIPALNHLSSWLADEDTQAKLSTFASKLGEIAALVFDTLLNAFDWIVNNGETMATIIELVAIAFVAVKAATDPIGTLFGILIAVGILLMANWETLKTAAEALGQKFQDWIVSKLEAIKTWADSAKTAVSDFISITIPETIANAVKAIADAWDSVTSAIGGAIEKLRTFLGIETEGNASNPNNPYGNNYHNTGTFAWPWGAKGWDYIPFDGFAARLHAGEAVLTAREAEVWRAEQSGSAERNRQPVTVNQYIDAVPQTASEFAFETANALRMMRFNV